MYKWLDILKQYARYEITVLEENQRSYELEEKTYKAEYRGLDKWEDYILFWIEGDSKAEGFHLGDIISAKQL